jgi:hypothetical protein
MDSSNQVRDKETQTKRIDVTELDTIARKMHERIKRRQLALMNLPKATEHEESAYGQLLLLGYADTVEEESNASRRRLFVVHRLDCEVSVLQSDGCSLNVKDTMPLTFAYIRHQE